MKPRSTGGGRGPSRGAPRGTKKHRGARPAPREHDGPRAPRPDKHSLGGSQVEGRQAVRELQRFKLRQQAPAFNSEK